MCEFLRVRRASTIVVADHCRQAGLTSAPPIIRAPHTRHRLGQISGALGAIGKTPEQVQRYASAIEKKSCETAGNDQVRGGGARKAIYTAAEDHTAAVNKKLDLLELEVAHVSRLSVFGGGGGCGGGGTARRLVGLSHFCPRVESPNAHRPPHLSLSLPSPQNKTQQQQISTVNHALKVQLLHVKARVLAQLIWSTTDTTLVEAEDGRTTRSPAAWSEASALTGAGTIKRCKDAVAEIIGASVAWRCCERVRPDLLAMFSLGSFNMEAFSREARKVCFVFCASVDGRCACS